jgi:hypothetical protein
MSPKNDLASVIADPRWLPAHWDSTQQKIDFAWLKRSDHSKLPFLSQQYLSPLAPPAASFPMGAVAEASGRLEGGPNYIFHSAFCCSTLLARALDVPGTAMTLNEPQILIELASAARGQLLHQPLLAMAIRLLGRPFGAGERVIVKPGNEANLLAPALMDLDPDARAIFLYAPLARFLGSVAGKGMWGRIWSRRLCLLLRRDTGLTLGLSDNDLLELTDLQAAALAWLMHRAQKLSLVQRFGARVRLLDSETFLARRAETLAAAGAHFGLALDDKQARQIADGLVFRTHSKELGRAVDPEQPLAQREPIAVIDEEIEMVGTWARAMADHAGLSFESPAQSMLLPSS